ncbi:hypothetical protein BGZ94_003357 [Podila epigama]|nr:hypothetical protein BGZ94_003357 [Podila epigama]
MLPQEQDQGNFMEHSHTPQHGQEHLQDTIGSASTSTAVPLPPPTPKSLEGLPLECIECILQNLAIDCKALHTLLLLNKTWFKMVAPFLYKSPIALIDLTWPKLSQYCQVLKPKPPLDDITYNEGNNQDSDQDNNHAHEDHAHDENIQTESLQMPGKQASEHAAPANLSPSIQTERMGRGSSSRATGSSHVVTRDQSRSSSHSSTRSATVDIFHSGRHQAVHERDRLIKRKKLQVLWLLLNCTITPQEFESLSSVPSSSSLPTSEDTPSSSTSQEQTSIPFTSLKPKSDLGISVDFFRPTTDYLSMYSHFHHPGLRFFIWVLFPTVEDAAIIERRLINHSPERIRELYLESVQLQDIIPLAPRLCYLYRIRTCHEVWDIQGCIRFMKEHKAHFDTIRMMELEAYLPDTYDTALDETTSQLFATVDHLQVLELSGFETLQTHLDIIPRASLKVLRFNCGSLDSTLLHNGPTSTAMGDSTSSEDNTGKKENTRPMTISSFLSECRQLQELSLKSVEGNMLDWAVKERREYEAAKLTNTMGTTTTKDSQNPSSPSGLPLAGPVSTSLRPLVPLRSIELSGTDSERVAMTISQAAEAFQDTLEVIKANSYSYQSNRTLTSLSWKCPMRRLEVLKIVGRSNLPFDFRSLQFCPELKVLDISKYSGMRASPEPMLLHMKYLTKLEYLGLSSFDHLSDSTVRTILGCMPKLKHLRLALRDTPVWNMSGSSSASSSSSSALPNPSSVSMSSSSSTPSSIVSASDPSTQDNVPLTSGMRMTGIISDLGTRLSFAAMSTPTQHSATSSTTSLSSSLTPSSQSGQAQQPAFRVPTSLAQPLGQGSHRTSSLMDRFHMENNYLSLEGILDAIRGLLETNQLEKLSIVLGKHDFEDHVHRLEMFNQLHPDLEIIVYRYAHAV